MKAFFTDERNNKKLLAESDSFEELVKAVVADAEKKFIFLGDVEFSGDKNEYKFTVTAGKDSGYSIEN